MARNRLLLVLHLVLAFGPLAASSPAQWRDQPSGTEARLRGISAAGPDIAWASGAGGTILRTEDGGRTWMRRPIPGTSDLDFRDIQAIGDRGAVALSIGEGAKSRIYRTKDAGETWTLQYTMDDPKGFLDAIAFWDADHGLALGDPAGGRFTILATDDGGLTWTKRSADGMPPCLEGEGAFAASGTCLVARDGHLAWFGTGGGKAARVFRSEDRGRTWTAHDTPVAAGKPTMGIFSVAFRDALHGVVVGGTYDRTDAADRVAARTDDGGKTWSLPMDPGPRGYRSAAIFAHVKDRALVIATGPSGSDVSDDDGRTWRALGDPGFHALAAGGAGAIWGVGERGRIARLR